jgi:hypothetical protein
MLLASRQKQTQCIIFGEYIIHGCFSVTHTAVKAKDAGAYKVHYIKMARFLKYVIQTLIN